MSPPTENHVISMTHDGRYLAVRHAAGIELMSTDQSTPRVPIPVESVEDFDWAGEHLLIARSDEVRLYGLTGELVSARPAADLGPGRWRICDGPEAATGIWAGSGARLFHWHDGVIDAHSLGHLAGDLVASVGGLRVVVTRGRQAELHDLRRGRLAGWKLPGTGLVSAVAPALGGRALVFLSSDANGGSLDVVHVKDARVNHVALPASRRFACADDRGFVVLVLDAGALLVLDLLHGNVMAEGQPPFPVLALSVESDATNLTLAGLDAEGSVAVLQTSYLDLFGRVPRAGRVAERPPPSSRRSEVAPVEPVAEPEVEAPPQADEAVPQRRRPEAFVPFRGRGRRGAADDEAVVEAAPLVDERSDAAPPPSDTAAATGEAGADAAAWPSEAVSEPAPETPDAAAVDAEVAPARPAPARRAQSARTSSRRALPDLPLSARRATALGPYAAPAEHFAHLLDAVAARAAAAIAEAWERGAPHDEDAAAEVVTLAGLPRGPSGLRATAEARLREVAGEIEQRSARPAAGGPLPLVAVVRAFGLSSLAAEILVATAAPAARGEIARLYGILSRSAAPRETCDRHLVEMLLGRRDARLRARIADELAEAGPLLATGLISAGPGLFAPLVVEEALLRRLRSTDAASGAEGDDDDDVDDARRELLALLDGAARVVMREAPGDWLASCAALRGMTIAELDAERLSAGELRRALARAALGRGIPCLRGLAWRLPGDEGELQAALDDHPGPILLRVPRDVRLPLAAGLATITPPEPSEDERRRLAAAAVEGLPASAVRVETLPRWDDLAVPDVTLDGIREILGRARAAGLTVLLWGPAGAGKASVAGLVARELGRDLYRVDVPDLAALPAALAERELCRALDGAADGQAVLLLAGAGELGHAVQRRLAARAGVVFVTRETSAPVGDVRLELPFPDEELRLRLWRLHAPPGPDDADLALLAGRAPLTGGAIRRSVERAILLAGEEEEPLGLAHLERAVRLERGGLR